MVTEMLNKLHTISLPIAKVKISSVIYHLQDYNGYRCIEFY